MSFEPNYSHIPIYCIMPSDNIEISTGNTVKSISNTSLIKQLLVDNTIPSFYIPCSFNGTRTKGKVKTLYLLIEESAHRSLQVFYYTVSKKLNIPALAPISFLSDEYDDKYVFSVRIPIDYYGLLHKDVYVKSDIIDRNPSNWTIDCSFLLEVKVEGIHFSDATDRNTTAHINYDLVGITDIDTLCNPDTNVFPTESTVPLSACHTFGDAFNGQTGSLEQQNIFYKDLLIVAEHKLAKYKKKNIELNKLYEDCQQIITDTKSELTHSNSINESLNSEINVLNNEREELKVTLKSQFDRIIELEDIVEQLMSKNHELLESIEEKDKIITNTKEWLEDIIPYYDSYSDNGIHYKGFSSYTATSEDLNKLKKKNIQKLITSGAWFQALPFKRMYTRGLMETIKSYNRYEKVGLRETLKGNKLLMEKLLKTYYDTENLSSIESYTRGNGW